MWIPGIRSDTRTNPSGNEERFDGDAVGVAAIGEKAAGVIADIGVADGVAAMMTISANGDWLIGSVSAWLTAGAASLAA